MDNRRFDKVLVANRGEIAVRVLRGARELGLRTVAVFSDADADAVHVRSADEAVHIGPPAPSQSYLDVAKIIDACRKTGAGAVHPGYGFLSENAQFAAALADAGLVFVGPPAHAIEAMGEKTRARELAVEAGVPVTPGTGGAIDDVEAALARAHEVGFPVLLKAAAGGGGKGMRLVNEPAAFAESLQACKREARGAFGDDRVYLEKYIVQPRHVEIQILADEHGNVRHLYERDCSIQRRHQKVIEETPCPVLNDATRQEMGRVAVQLAKAVDYVGAGTVEFLLDAQQNFYFMEMNTRLQVEHTVTELITGVDLVHAQLSIAQGEAISWRQEDLPRHGAAIQCRIYAEDPAQNFMPSPGHISRLRVPSGPGVRDDSGYESGCEVPRHYDPLISKLVVWSHDRPSAIARMRRALTEYVVMGIRTNIPFHVMALEHDEFTSGKYTTGFVPEHIAAGGDLAARPSNEVVHIAELAAAIAEDIAAGTTGAAQHASNGAKPHASPWRVYSRFRRLSRA